MSQQDQKITINGRSIEDYYNDYDIEEIGMNDEDVMDYEVDDDYGYSDTVTYEKIRNTRRDYI